MKFSRRSLTKSFGPLLALVFLPGLLITGCDDGAKSARSGPAAMEARISGFIKDQNGPIFNSRLEVTDKGGRIISSMELSNTNEFAISVPGGTSYPIVITAHPTGASAANSSAVKAVVTSPLADRMDVTDVSTIVVDSAMSLGGLTPENIAKASGAAISLRQREGVSAGAGGGGGGAGQSGGGASRGGHGGHGAPEGGASSSATGTAGEQRGHDTSGGSH